MILAGDVGGTSTRLARVVEEEGGLSLLDRETLPSGDFDSLAGLVADYRRSVPGEVKAACFAVAGPVLAGRSRITNLPWVLEEDALARDLGAARVVLVNDLVGNGLGLDELPETAFETLQEGRCDPDGNAALISPGTGLGMALLVRSGDRRLVRPSEGGHAEYPPRNDEEDGLVRALRGRLGRVEIEDLLSGSGLVRIFEHMGGRAQSGDDDPAAAVSRAALEGGDGTARRALDLWVSMLGSVAGNLALTALSTAGLYVGGGIPPKVLPALQSGTLLEAFLHKGKFRGLLEGVPVRVVLDDRAALLGAARRALEAASAR